MRALDPVNAVGNMEILAIEVAGMAGVNAEVAGYCNHQLRRRGGSDVNSDVLRTERSAATNLSVVAVIGNNQVVQYGWAEVYRVAEGCTLRKDRVTAEGSKNILATDNWIVTEL